MKRVNSKIEFTVRNMSSSRAQDLKRNLEFRQGPIPLAFVLVFKCDEAREFSVPHRKPVGNYKEFRKAINCCCSLGVNLRKRSETSRASPR